MKIINLKKCFMISVCLSQLFLFSSMVSAKEVGKVVYARGAVTMQNLDGSSGRLVVKNNELTQGEVIKTGPRSYTILKLNDGTRMTLRANSSFSVDEMNAKKDSTASATLRLFRGGLRAITGFISKKNPRGYKLRTAVATIGIRGTEFDMRLCENDCAKENAKLNKKRDRQLDKTVARVVFARGSLSAVNKKGKSRGLASGSSVFEGDTLKTKNKSYSIIVFKDKSRISLQANTVFRIDKMAFDKEKEKQSSGLFSLLRGGLRTVTGLLGKKYPKRYKMRTQVATIGIRGTGYDLLCTGLCMSPEFQQAALESALQSDKSASNKLPEGEGLYANVWDGAIAMGEQVLSKGEAGFKLNKTSKPIVLPEVPSFFKDNAVPKPNDIEVNENELFTQVDAEEAPPGLYVSVTEGEVSVKGVVGGQLTLKAGEAGFTDVLGREVVPLPTIPAFQKFDSYPVPDAPAPGVMELKAGTIGSDDGGTVCEI